VIQVLVSLIVSYIQKWVITCHCIGYRQQYAYPTLGDTLGQHFLPLYDYKNSTHIITRLGLVALTSDQSETLRFDIRKPCS
jgi:hypothetical protein